MLELLNNNNKGGKRERIIEANSNWKEKRRFKFTRSERVANVKWTKERERGGENVKKEEEREKEDKSLWRERLRLFVSSLAPPIKNKKN